MLRRRYLILLWDFAEEAAERAALRRIEALEASGAWRRTFVEPGWSLILEPDTGLHVRRLMDASGLVLGDLYPMNEGGPEPGSSLAASADARSPEVFAALSRRWWGRYVALHRSAVTEPLSAFRDPSGALECLTWRRERLRVVASHLPDEHRDLMPRGLGVDWEAAGRRLGNPAATASGLALTGIEAIDAGQMMDLKTAERKMIWRPAAFASAQRQPRDVLTTRMRERVDQVVEAHAGQAGTILAEVSGGLDSAIVAGALQTTAAGKVVQWANFYTQDCEGDERLFARAVAAQLRLPLTEVAKAELQLTEEHLTVVGAGLRPSTLGVDYEQDEDSVARCAQVGADTMITGLGGDAVFLQTQSPLIAADAVHAGLGGRELFRVFRDVATMRRSSVWSAATTGVIGALSRSVPRRTPAYLNRELVGRLSNAPTHPWLADLADVAPGKRAQIRTLTASLLFHGHSRRGQAVDVIHPLLSQPLVELLLSIPAFDLALGTHDRALAREAFADRLPGEVLRRRSKGDLQAYYGRMFSRSLPFARPYLQEGLLVRERLVDRSFLEQALTPESLLWRDLNSNLVQLLAVEAWARHWQGVA
ncbi:MAG TPA: asparagine synthase C-terminal domain-containing protein [Caulobacteraceae bacterium]|jgi:asparagine synthase (glutamine-hydrolysing)